MLGLHRKVLKLLWELQRKSEGQICVISQHALMAAMNATEVELPSRVGEQCVAAKLSDFPSSLSSSLAHVSHKLCPLGRPAGRRELRSEQQRGPGRDPTTDLEFGFGTLGTHQGPTGAGRSQRFGWLRD